MTIGSGPKVFSSGFNMGYWMNREDDDASLGVKLLQIVLARLHTANVPTLCIVNGIAIAGGCLIALAHDHVIMKNGNDYKKVYMFMNETENGFSIPYPIT